MKVRRWIRPWAVLLVVVAALCVLLVTTYIRQRQATSALEAAAGVVPAAAAEGGNKAVTAIRDFFSWLVSWRTQGAEIQALQNRVAELETEIGRLEEVKQENTRLTTLMGFAEAYPEFDYVQAAVTSRDPATWLTEFVINRGSQDGIQKDMAVVTQDGLVGRIKDVGPNYATVICLINNQNAVSVVVERTRDEGIIKGGVDPQSAAPHCRLHYLPFNADLVPGDTVVTSNLGGYYPRGLVVGTVVEASRAGTGQEQYAIVQPAVDFGHLENVLVLTADHGDATQDDAHTATPSQTEPTPTQPAATDSTKPTPTPEGGGTP